MPGRLTGIEFTSAGLTAQGVAQTVAHGLRGAPRKSWIEITGLNAVPEAGTAIITAVDATNITYTVDSTQITNYVIHAIL